MIILWIVNLKDGSTVTEREMDWDDLPVEEITCLHLTNGKSSAFIRAREGYQFFQFKKRAILLNALTGEMSKTPLIWQRIGAVVDNEGNCIYIETGKDGTFDTRFDNVLDMKLNLPHLRIHLPEEVIQKKMGDLNGQSS